MFARQRATKLQRHIEQIVNGPLHSGEFFLVALVAEDGRVQIAVPGMSEGADGEVVLFAEALDDLHHGRDLGAGHGGVFKDGRGLEAGQGGQGLAAGFPDPVLFPDYTDDSASQTDKWIHTAEVILPEPHVQLPFPVL